MAAIPPSTFERRVRGLEHGTFARLVADIWAADGWDTRIDGAVVHATRSNQEERLLVLRPGRFQRLRSAPTVEEQVDRVIVPMAAGNTRPRNLPDAPILDTEDLRNRLLYAIESDPAEAIARKTLGVPLRDERWERGVSVRRWGRRIVIACVAIAAVLLVAGVLWGVPTIDPVVHEEAPLAEPFEAESPSSPDQPATLAVETPDDVADAATIYAGRANGSIEAWQPDDGEVIWRTETSGGQIAASPIVANGTLFATSVDGAVHAVDAVTGEHRWTTNATHGVFAAPSADDDLVFVKDADRGIVALGAAEGDVRWAHTETTDARFGPPDVADGIVYHLMTNGTLVAFDGQTGEPVWELDPPDEHAVEDVTHDNTTAYAWVSDGTVWALDRDTGETLWHREFPDRVTASSMRAQNESLIITTRGPNSGILELSDNGTVRWSIRGNVSDVTSPAVTTERIYAGTADGHLLAIDRENGSVDWRSDPLGARPFDTPEVTADTVYLGTLTGELYALNRSTGAFEWEEPVQQGGSFVSPTVIDELIVLDTPDRVLRVVAAADGDVLWSFALTSERQQPRFAVEEDPLPPPPDAETDPRVVSVSAPDTAEPGERAILTARVENHGTEGTAPITWTLDDAGPSPADVHLAAHVPSVITARFTLPDDPGPMDYEVTVGEDTATGTIDVLEPPRFRVEISEDPRTIPGQDARIAIAVENTGEIGDVAAIDVHYAGAVVAETAIAVAPNETVDLTLTVPPPERSPWDPRPHEHRVAVTSQHDHTESMLVVERPPLLPRVLRWEILVIVGVLVLLWHSHRPPGTGHS